jgi:hypothetical protein
MSTNADGAHWTTTADQFHSKDARQASSVTSWKPDVGSLSGLTLLKMRCVKPSCDASVLVSFFEYVHTHAELREIEGAQENHDCMVVSTDTSRRVTQTYSNVRAQRARRGEA